MLFGKGPAIVVQLSERMPRQFLVDKFFALYWLFHWLFKIRIYAAATSREDGVSK